MATCWMGTHRGWPCGRTFTAGEQEVAWAASLWPATRNARWEALYGDPPLCGTALRAQAAERLRRANV